MVVVALALVLVTAACGSRRSDQDLAAAAGSSSGRLASAAGEADAGLEDLAAGDLGSTDGEGDGVSANGGSGRNAGTATGAAAGKAGVAGKVGAQATAKGKEIVIGSVGSISGIVGAALKPGVEGLRVWVQWVNSKGGVNGHPVKLIVADDQSDPARHRSLVQQMVEEQGAIAFVQNAEALSGAGSVSYHQDKRIPVIGSEGSNQYWNENSMYFPQMSHGSNFVLATFAANAQWGVEHGVTKLGQIVCTEAASCSASLGMSQKHAKNFGVEIVYSAQASFAKPDYTAECLNAKNAGAQGFIVGFDGNGISRLAAACARQGYNPVYFVPSASSAVQHLTDNNMKQLVVNSPVAPFGSPATQEMAEAFSRYLPDTTVLVSHVEGWTAGKMLERAARNFTADPVTTEVLLQGLWTVKNEDLGGLSGPQTFNRDAPVTPSTCWFLMEGKDGKFVPYNGGKRTCTDIEP
jgi:branched-chain amino acid transport system substrate-binding protein